MSDRCYECGSEDSVCVDCTYKPLLERVEKVGQRLRDRTGEWKLALHERDELRERAERAEAWIKRLRERLSDAWDASEVP